MKKPDHAKKTKQRILAVYRVERDWRRDEALPKSHLIRARGRDGYHYGWYVYNKRDELDVWLWAKRHIRRRAAENWMWRWEDGEASFGLHRYPYEEPEEGEKVAYDQEGEKKEKQYE